MPLPTGITEISVQIEHIRRWVVRNDPHHGPLCLVLLIEHRLMSRRAFLGLGNTVLHVDPPQLE